MLKIGLISSYIFKMSPTLRGTWDFLYTGIMNDVNIMQWKKRIGKNCIFRPDEMQHPKFHMVRCTIGSYFQPSVHDTKRTHDIVHGLITTLQKYSKCPLCHLQNAKWSYSCLGGWGNLASQNPAPEEEIINSCPARLIV